MKTCQECDYFKGGKCTDETDWRNSNGEPVCGLRDDAIHPDDQQNDEP